jgi:hypothetical protein
MPTVPKCAKNAHHVKVVANEVSVAVKVVVNAAIVGASVVKPTRQHLN